MNTCKLQLGEEPTKLRIGTGQPSWRLAPYLILISQYLLNRDWETSNAYKKEMSVNEINYSPIKTYFFRENCNGGIDDNNWNQPKNQNKLIAFLGQQVSVVSK